MIQWTATRTEVQTAWRPPADVYETPTRVSVTIELAGIEPAEVAVLFFDQAIVVEGRRRLPALDETRPAATDGVLPVPGGIGSNESGKR